jgi:hypothetical protein
VIATKAKDCQVLIWQLKAKHKQIALQWIPGHCQIAGNEHAHALAKKDAKITQTHIRETSYRSIKLHIKEVFQSVYRHELPTKLPKNHGSKKQPKYQMAKKKGSCRISIVCWAWLLGYTSSLHWNLPRPLLYATQPPQTHGQKPSRTMYHII